MLLGAQNRKKKTIFTCNVSLDPSCQSSAVLYVDNPRILESSLLFLIVVRQNTYLDGFVCHYIERVNFSNRLLD